MPISFISTETDFCSVCGAILPLPECDDVETAPCVITCRLCGSTSNVKEKISELVCRLEKVYEKRVVDDVGDSKDVDSVVEHICPKCNHGQATYSTMQTRSADEGQTVFYTCLNCKHKTIEYS